MKSIDIINLNNIISANFDGEYLDVSYEKKLLESDDLKEYFNNEYVKYCKIKNSITKIKTRISNLF